MSPPAPIAAESSLSTAQVLDIMREVSLQTDPQRLVSTFRRYTTPIFGGDGSISLSRRGLSPPEFRITRDTRWQEDVDPWKQADKLPLLRGGVLAEWLYGDKAHILNDFELPSSDPAHSHLGQVRSLMVVPIYDAGAALNMVVRFAYEPHAFDESRLPDAILIANLVGRGTSHLLTTKRLEQAYAQLDHEMKRVAALQRSLLPSQFPRIPGVDIAASYKTAARAGGDYYDFFDVGDGRWGILIADVSGHGTPAAVIMAMLRTMLHNQCHGSGSPKKVFESVNRPLCQHAGRYDGMFVTAFYGIYDPRDGSLHYASAGHHPPLLVGAGGTVRELDEAQALPLAVQDQCEFPQSTIHLNRGDTLLLYTDGITDATNSQGECYGRERLLVCVREDVPFAQHIVDCVTHRLLAFTDGRPQEDDQTLVAVRVK